MTHHQRWDSSVLIKKEKGLLMGMENMKGNYREEILLDDWNYISISRYLGSHDVTELYHDGRLESVQEDVGSDARLSICRGLFEIPYETDVSTAQLTSHLSFRSEYGYGKVSTFDSVHPSKFLRSAAEREAAKMYRSQCDALFKKRCPFEPTLIDEAIRKLHISPKLIEDPITTVVPKIMARIRG